MDWISQNLQILATLGSALAVYGFLRAGAKRDIESLRNDIRDVKVELQSIDGRLSKLEGAFEERGRSEQKIFLIKGDQITPVQEHK